MAVTTEMIATDLGRAAPTVGSTLAMQWEMWIDDAYMLIEDRRVDVGADAIPAMKLDYVVRKAVVSHVQKPDDATTITVAVDDGSTSRRYESGKGRVSVDDWWSYLGLAGSEEAFTIRPAALPPVITDPFAW